MASGPTTVNVSAVSLGLFQIRVGNSASNIATTTAVLTSSNSLGALAETSFAAEVEWHKIMSGFPQREDGAIPLSEMFSITAAFRELTPFNMALARGIDPMATVSATAAEAATAVVAGTGATDWSGNPITVTDTAGPVNDTFICVFSTADDADCYGVATGDLGTFDKTAGPFAPDNGGNPYFSIPDAFFTGIWAAGDSFSFRTTIYQLGTAAYGSTHSGSIALGSMASPAFVRVEAVLTYPNGTNTLSIILPRAQCSSSVEADFATDDETAIPINFDAKAADSTVSGGDAAWDAMPIGQMIWA